MNVDPAKAAGNEACQGKTYWFCSAHCVSTFKAEPGRYAAGGGQASTHEHHAGRGSDERKESKP